MSNLSVFAFARGDQDDNEEFLFELAFKLLALDKAPQAGQPTPFGLFDVDDFVDCGDDDELFHRLVEVEKLSDRGVVTVPDVPTRVLCFAVLSGHLAELGEGVVDHDVARRCLDFGHLLKLEIVVIDLDEHAEFFVVEKEGEPFALEVNESDALRVLLDESFERVRLTGPTLADDEDVRF